MSAIRLLHIEDNEDYRDLMAATLKLEPTLAFSLVSAGSLGEGLHKLCAEGPFDEVLLDWGLPDGSGVQAIGGIRALDPNLGIVVFTGHDEKEVVKAAGNAGADHFLLKGANIKTVLTSLHFAACRHRQPGDSVIRALEAMLASLESATESIEQIASEVKPNES